MSTYVEPIHVYTYKKGADVNRNGLAIFLVLFAVGMMLWAP